MQTTLILGKIKVLYAVKEANGRIYSIQKIPYQEKDRWLCKGYNVVQFTGTPKEVAEFNEFNTAWLEDHKKQFQHE